MLGALVRPSETVRRAITLAAALALFLPLPAQCASCAVGKTDCSHCQAAHANTAPPVHRSCCDRHAVAKPKADSTANCANHVDAKTCGCKLQTPDRTYVTVDRVVIAPDLIAMLPTAQPLLSADAGRASFAAELFGSLPPPVPHRILHCSWII
jgi:hypothetical protein